MIKTNHPHSLANIDIALSLRTSSRISFPDATMTIPCSDIPEFLCQMNLDPTDQVVIVTNGSEEMKREEEAFASQLWIQGNRHMTAANPVIFGDPNSREAAILSAVYEAVSWRHTLENGVEGPRKGQRVVIYPKELTGLAQAITTRNVVVQDDVEDHAELYAAILSKCAEFENPSIFMTENCDQLIANPVWATKIGEWMIMAARVATGGRRRVLEDGPDVMNSDDEDSRVEEHGDKLTGCFVGCSSLEDARMTEQQAQELRASATFSSSLTFQPSEPARPKSPIGEDWTWMNPKEQRFASAAVESLAKTPAQAPPKEAVRIPDSVVQAPAKAAPVTIVKATSVQAEELPEGLKAATAPLQAPAGQSKGNKT
jgi:hypothetical protein